MSSDVQDSTAAAGGSETTRGRGVLTARLLGHVGRRALRRLGVARPAGHEPLSTPLNAGDPAQGVDPTPVHEPLQMPGLRGFDLRVTSGSAVLRPLRITDAGAWTRSRLANAHRMSQWWGEADWAAASNEDAFLEHYLSWALTRRRSRGFAFAITDRDELVGEAMVYLRHGGGAAEYGLWMRPDGVAPRHLVGLLGGLTDQLFAHGVERIDAPVAVGNDQPVRLLRIGGFTLEGTMHRWRPLADAMVDMELYGLTSDQWPGHRSRVLRLTSWESALAGRPVPLARLSAPAVAGRPATLETGTGAEELVTPSTTAAMSTSVGGARTLPIRRTDESRRLGHGRHAVRQ